MEAYGAVRDSNRRVIEFSFEHMMVVREILRLKTIFKHVLTTEAQTQHLRFFDRLITKASLGHSPTPKCLKVGGVKMERGPLESFYLSSKRL